MTPEDRERRIRELADRMAERLAEHWPEGNLTVNDIEALAERVGQDVQREISERFLQEEAERKEGNQRACPCGGRAFYQRHHGLTVVTAAGRLRLRRAYYACERCGKGHCPADARLGLGPANTTPTAQARLAVLSALEPYVQVGDLLAQLGSPLQLDLKGTERVAQAVGARLAAVPLRPHGEAARLVALGFDAVMIPTWVGCKEARYGVIYEPDWEAGRTPEAEAGLRKEYFATTGSRESLVRAVCVRARERAAGAGVAVVWVGAALDWVNLDLSLPKRVEILEFYPVLERIAELARTMHPDAATATATAGRGAMKRELLGWGPRKLLEALAGWVPENAAAQEVRRVQLASFERQRERMRYPDYLRRGLPIGSGAAEGACKHGVADRFDGGGMRWKMETADPVMRLRAALLTQPRLDLRPFTGGKKTSAGT
jgi:hypothetical protein